jgi:hypothetical protein
MASSSEWEGIDVSCVVENGLLVASCCFLPKQIRAHILCRNAADMAENADVGNENNSTAPAIAWHRRAIVLLVRCGRWRDC